jgi:hypothetical protein
MNGTGRDGSDPAAHSGAGVLVRGKQRAPLDTVRVTPRRNEARIAPHQGRLPLHVWVSQPNASLDMARLVVEAESGSVPCDQQGRGSGSLQVRHLQGRTSRDESRSIAGSGPAPRQCVCPVSLHELDPSGLVTLQVAAAHDAPLDIVYYLTKYRPEHHRSRASDAIARRTKRHKATEAGTSIDILSTSPNDGGEHVLSRKGDTSRG